MDILLNLFFSQFFLVFLITSFGSLTVNAADYTTLVYKGCSKQAFPLDSNGLYPQTLTTLFNSLVSQSSKTKFFKTTSGSAQQTSITGLFQCRGDLSNGDCYKCVSKLPEISKGLCGRTVAARVQLLGCYILYEVSGFPQISGFELLYKTCSGSQIQGSGFEQRRDTAFSSLESGIVSGNGFYATSYESVYVVAQCEGDLSAGDCGVCVKNSVQRAQVECGSSVSAQIYLHKCFLSYAYYPNGVSRKASSGGSGQNTGKTIAIVVGGAAGVGFGVICLMFVRSVLKKRDDY